MKKILLFLAVASTTMFVSCSDDDSKGGGKTDPDAATSIVLAANIATIEAGSGEAVILTVTDNKTNVVTSDATFFANDVEISGSTFTSDVEGTFTLKATYKNSNDVVLTSNTVTVTVTPAVVVPEAQGKYTFNGTDYAIDNMYYIVDVNASNQVKVFEYDNNGVTVLCSRWIGVAFNGARADVATATHYYEYLFYVPVVVDGEGNPTALNYPGEAVAFADSVYAEEDLTPFALDAVDGGTATFTSFVTAENAATSTENSTSFTTAGAVTITHSFDGTLAGTDANPTGIGAVNLDGKAARGVSKSKTILTQMLNINNLKLSKKITR